MKLLLVKSEKFESQTQKDIANTAAGAYYACHSKRSIVYDTQQYPCRCHRRHPCKSHTPVLLQKPYTTLSLAAIIIADFRPIVKHHFWKKRRALTGDRNPVKKILHFFKKGLHCDVKCAIISL